MTERDKLPPHLTAAGSEAAQQRRERQAAALRANLARRKAQARERAERQPSPGGAAKDSG
jgi:hypothetical protein